MSEIDPQYSTGLSRHGIEQALAAAGKDLGNVQPADLTQLEDFHTMGRIATTRLAGLANISSADEVLDAGSGVGGTARFLATQYRCRVTAVDLTEEYCETSRWLNQLIGLDDRIRVQQADVTALPFPAGSFNVVFSQHVQMNVSDKGRLYREARRVLVPGGRLAFWDIAAGTPGELDYPLPWADRPELSHLVSPTELRAAIESAGLAVSDWTDLTEEATALMQAVLALPPNPLGLHAFVENFAAKAANLTRALSDGRLRAIQGIAVAAGEDSR
jgi:sarcosine/dimethylglycine N-methyltransferase